MLGLRWSDIDLERGILTVNGSLGWIKGKGLVYGPPKTESGQRAFKLPASLVSALKRYQLRAAAERKAAGDRWQASEYVFTSTKHGGALNPAQLWQAFRAAADRAGLTGFTLHSLRHSCASFLHAEGVALKTISAYLGHSDTQVTNDIYIHLFDDAINDAAAVLESRLGQLDMELSESDN